MGKDHKGSRKNIVRNISNLRMRLLFKKPVFARKPRSPKWRKVRREHLSTFNECMACGGRVSLEVHHLVPYQVSPELELDPDNLITLCESKSRCHWIIGHLLNWRSYNPSAREDAIAFRMKLVNRPVV